MHCLIFFNNDVMNLILSETNKYGESLKTSAQGQHSRAQQWEPLSREEFNIFLGLSLLMGVVKKQSISDYWSENAMTLTRSQFRRPTCNSNLTIAINLI